jgi:hypothetical protein
MSPRVSSVTITPPGCANLARSGKFGVPRCARVPLPEGQDYPSGSPEDRGCRSPHRRLLFKARSALVPGPDEVMGHEGGSMEPIQMAGASARRPRWVAERSRRAWLMRYPDPHSGPKGCSLWSARWDSFAATISPRRTLPASHVRETSVSPLAVRGSRSLWCVRALAARQTRPTETPSEICWVEAARHGTDDVALRRLQAAIYVNTKVWYA